MNVVAASLRIRERAIPFVRQLVETARTGATFQTVRRRCLRVGEHLGFIFGNGLMANFLGEYYGTGKYGPARAAWLLLRRLRLGGGRRTVRQEALQAVRRDTGARRRAAGRTSFVGVGAATVREVGLGFKLNHRADDDRNASDFWPSTPAPSPIIPDFVAVHRGKGVAAQPGDERGCIDPARRRRQGRNDVVHHRRRPLPTQGPLEHLASGRRSISFGPPAR